MKYFRYFLLISFLLWLFFANYKNISAQNLNLNIDQGPCCYCSGPYGGQCEVLPAYTPSRSQYATLIGLQAGDCYSVDCASHADCPGYLGGAQPFQNPEASPPIEFRLQIPIPGSQIFTGQPITINSDLLGNYIAALYTFFVGALGIISVVVMMIGGFLWLTSGGAGERISKAKSTILNAIIGLILAITSYLLLYTLNPNLVNFQSLVLESIKPLTYEQGLVVFENIPNLVFNGIQSQPICQPQTYLALQTAAAQLQEKDKKLIIASGTRSYEEQRAQYESWCQKGNCSNACNPDTSTGCPHVKGLAVDIQNYSDSDVISAMKSAGFCRLTTEAWHFEYPPLSANCTTNY